MPRPPRHDFPGAWHHVMHRGARRAPIFREEVDHTLLLDCFEDAVERFGVEVHAYALVSNHYHLLMHTPRANLSRAMAHINGTYTQRMNRLYRWDGPVFRGRFRSELVSDDEYRQTLVCYIHLNPLNVKGATVRDPADPLWTSHAALVGLARCPDWLSTWGVERLFGTPEGLDRAVRAYHIGQRQWPDDFDPEAVGRRRRHRSPSPSFAPEYTRPPVDLSDALARIEVASATSLDELRIAKRGRGANTARRFAVFALRRLTDATNRQIGEALDMSLQQVANTLHQIKRRGLPDHTDAWCAALGLDTLRRSARLKR